MLPSWIGLIQRRRHRLDRGGWAQLVRRVDNKPLPVVQPTLFCPEPQAEPVPESVTVNVKGVRVEATRDFGDVWLGLLLWSTLGLDRLFKQILPEGRRGGRGSAGGDPGARAFLRALQYE